MGKSKTILVAALNRGLGHATRCIPIIKALEKEGYIPIIASEGQALDLLSLEFPHLKSIELPAYQIEYAKDEKNTNLKLIQDSPKLLAAVTEERKIIKRLVKEKKIDGILSDNRLGCYHKKVPSVFITHQLNSLSGKVTWVNSHIHRQVMDKFQECWVLDVKDEPNLSGKLGHLKKTDLSLKYIGPLSRFTKKKMKHRYQLAILLSGPEPQRSILENKLFEQVEELEGTILFVRGKVAAEQQRFVFKNCHVYNFMKTKDLEKALNQSAFILCRSGYANIMDLAILGKKAFLIPTPGHYEQEYLATYLQKQGWIPFSSQEDFKMKKLKNIDTYSGLPSFRKKLDFVRLFSLFESK